MPIRPPWQVDAKVHIRPLGDDELRELVEQLALAEAGRCRANRSEVVISREVKAGDEGSDGFTPAHGGVSDWLPNVGTCWQLKAGAAGGPERLRGEVAKSRPSARLKEGGAFVVVASGSVAGDTGKARRLEVLREDAEGLGLPTDNIRVYTAESLATWCNQHPPIAFSLTHTPSSLQRLDDWSRDRRHEGPYFPPEGTPAENFDGLRATIGDDNPLSFHIHVGGPPGIGKSRFALELCRAAWWSSQVLFAVFPTPELFDLISSVGGRTDDVRLVLVVDECSPEQVLRLHDVAAPFGKRVRLVTIGHDRVPASHRKVNLVSLKEMTRKEVEEILSQTCKFWLKIHWFL